MHSCQSSFPPLMAKRTHLPHSGLCPRLELTPFVSHTRSDFVTMSLLLLLLRDEGGAASHGESSLRAERRSGASLSAVTAVFGFVANSRPLMLENAFGEGVSVAERYVLAFLCG